MSVSENKIVKKTVLYLALANFLTFLLYYVFSYLIANQTTLYVFYYVTEIANTLFPLVASSALFLVYRKSGVNRCLLHALFYSLTWILNLFPYYAFEYAYQTIEIGSVIFFTSIHTLFMVAVMYIEITVLFLLMIFAEKKFARDKAISVNISEKISATDFSNPRTLGLFSASMAMFVYNLTCEIIDTISFVREVEGFYETGEILYIVFRYLFILIMLIGCHFATVYISNKTSNNLKAEN